MNNWGMSNRMYWPMEVIYTEPYVIATLKTIIGKRVLVETIRGSIQGRLIDVKPDHVVLREVSGDTTFFVRLREIVYVMPNED